MVIQIITKTFIDLKWSIITSIDAPYQHTCDFNSLHFLSYLLSSKIDLQNSTRKTNYIITRKNKSFHSNSCLYHLSSSEDDHIIFRSGFLPELLSKIKSKLACVSKEQKNNQLCNWSCIIHFIYEVYLKINYIKICEN